MQQSSASGRKKPVSHGRLARPSAKNGVLAMLSISSVTSEMVRHQGAYAHLMEDDLHRRAPLPNVQIAPGSSAKRSGAAWDGISVEIVQVARREKCEFRFKESAHLLVAHEEGERQDGETHVEGLPCSKLRDVRYKMTFVPAGYEYRESYEPRVQSRIIFLYIDPAKNPARAGLDVKAALRPKMLFEDAALRGTVTKIAAAIEAGLVEECYLSALDAVLIHELVRALQGAETKETAARGGLAGWQRRAVTAYIEEHLDEPITLAKLAGLARLSPFYFCRAFKQAFGVPPRRYHCMRRIERAKGMLANASSSVTEIGLEIGFSETSSFTAAFRKATGQTPTAYRRRYS